MICRARTIARWGCTGRHCAQSLRPWAGPGWGRGWQSPGSSQQHGELDCIFTMLNVLHVWNQNLIHFPSDFSSRPGHVMSWSVTLWLTSPEGRGRWVTWWPWSATATRRWCLNICFISTNWQIHFQCLMQWFFLVFSSDRSSRSYSVCPCVIFSYSSINFQIFVSAVSQVFLRSLSAGSHQSCSSLSGGLSGVSQGSLLCRCRHRNKRLVVIKGSQIWSIKSFLWWLKECLAQPMCTKYKVRCSV